MIELSVIDIWFRESHSLQLVSVFILSFFVSSDKSTNRMNRVLKSSCSISSRTLLSFTVS